MIFGDGVALIPKNNDLTNTKNEFIKSLNRIGQPLEGYYKVYYQIPQRLKDLLNDLVSRLGGSSTGRVDFRVAVDNPNDLDQASEECYYFIEINPIPTMNDNSDFVGGIVHSLAENRLESSSQLLKLIKNNTESTSIGTLIAFSMLSYSEFTSKNNEQSGINLSDE